MKKLTIIIACALLLSSCATVFSGTKQKVRFQSNTEGATVKLNTHPIGQTNTDISIKKRSMMGLVQISKEGCKTKEMELPLSIEPTYYLNVPVILLYGVGAIGVMWDLGNHAYLKTEKVIYVELDCSGK